MAYDHAHAAASDHKDASKNAGAAPGKATVTGKMAGKATSLEERLEALESHLDELDELGLKLMANLGSGTAATFAVVVRAKLDAGGQVAEKLRGARTTLKRKGLYEAAHDALTRLLALEAQFGKVADSIIASSSAKQGKSADAFGVHIDAKEAEPEPEMDPSPDRPITGFETVDQRFKCEQMGAADEPHNVCNLAPLDRIVVLTYGLQWINSAMANFTTAIGNVKLKKILATPNGWGFLAEVLFYSVTGPLIARFVKGLQAAAMVAPSFGAVTPPKGFQLSKDSATATLTNLSRGLRGVLRHDVNSPGEDEKIEADFFSWAQDQIKTLGDNLGAEAPSVLDDADLCSFFLGFRDAKAHGVPAYEKQIRDMVATFEQQDIGHIGTNDDRKLRVVKLRAHGVDRMALLIQQKKFRYPRERKAVSLLQVDDTDYFHGANFHGWVDGQFEGLAAELQQERNGAPVPTYDVSAGHHFNVAEDAVDNSLLMADTLDSWIEKCRAKSQEEEAEPAMESQVAS